MKILIVTAGSRGDVQPYVALGSGLRTAGHHVTLCTCGRFESFVTDHGLEYAYMNDELLELVDSEAGRVVIARAGGFFGLIKTMMQLQKRAKDINRKTFREVRLAGESLQPDVIVYHPKAIAGPHVAELLGIPVLLAEPVPVMVPTREFAAVGFPDLRLGHWFNALSYRLIYKGMRSYNDVVNELRQEAGLKDVNPKISPLEQQDGRPIPVLNGFSESVVPRPADWPDTSHITGYWFLDHPNTTLPDDLRAFLEDGAPPVYVGFGSMAARDPERIGQIVIDALSQVGERGVLAWGWGGLKAQDVPKSIFVTEGVDHSLLFPHVKAVVHHGGAGTTAAGLRAGKPTVVCPFIIDQPFWGRRVNELGAGPRPIPQKKLTAKRLTAAIGEATTSPAIRDAAESIGQHLRKENGVAEAVRLIERYRETYNR